MAIANYTKYEDDDGGIHRIRLSSTRATAAGAAPAGDIDNDIDAKVSKSNNEIGIRPRRLTLSRIVGTAPNQFRQRTTLPILTPTAFDGFAKGDEVTINSVAWTVVNKQGEDY